MRTWKRVGTGLVVVIALGAAGFAGYVRLAPDDAAAWNVDPTTAPDPTTPNFARLAPGEVTGTDVATLAKRVDDAMQAMPRTHILAGSAGSGQVTYITRSALMGYPDYTSIRVFQDGDHAALAAFARSRYGKSDLGVNSARMDRLREALM